jgi:hypothetical protein
MSYKIIKKDTGTIGPSSTVDNSVARFDGTDGSTLDDSKITVDDDGKTIIDGSTLDTSETVLTILTPDASASNERYGLLISDSSGPSSLYSGWKPGLALSTGDDAPHFIAFQNENGEGWVGINSNSSMSYGTTGAVNIDFYTNNTQRLLIDSNGIVRARGELQVNTDRNASSVLIVYGTDSQNAITVINSSDENTFTVHENGTVTANSVTTPTVSAASGALTLSGTEISANSNRVTNVDDPTSAQDAATRNYVDTPIAMNAAGNSGSTKTLDFARMITQAVTMTDNCTFTFDNPSSGGTYLVKLTQGGAGSFTATWPASVKWAGGAAPTLSTAVGAIDILTFFYDGTNYFGNAGLNYA